MFCQACISLFKSLFTFTSSFVLYQNASTTSLVWLIFQALLDVGVIPGGDMTPEAALAKLSYIIGKETYTHEKKRKVNYA